MKKLFLLFLCFTFVALFFCACQIQLEQNGEHLTANAPLEYTKEATDTQEERTLETEAAPEIVQDATSNSEATEDPLVSEWKTAYLDYLESKKDSHLFYALVYIDDDDIPELYVSGNCEAEGDGICSYKNGLVVEQRLNRIGGGRYIERSGDIINQNGNMGHCYTHVYKLTDDGFTLTFSALSAESIEYLENEEYNIFYEYSIENKPVSEDEYITAVNAVFNFAQSVRLDENTVEYNVIKQQITDCK